MAMMMIPAGLYFDIGKEGGPPGKRHHLQLLTYYQHANGRYRLRVTTTAGLWSPDPASLNSVAASFDQETSAVMLARNAVHRFETAGACGRAGRGSQAQWLRRLWRWRLC